MFYKTQTQVIKLIKKGDKMPYQDDKFESIATKDEFLASEVGKKIINLCIEVEEAREFLGDAFHGPKVRAASEGLALKRAEFRALLELKGFI